MIKEGDERKRKEEAHFISIKKKLRKIGSIWFFLERIINLKEIVKFKFF